MAQPTPVPRPTPVEGGLAPAPDHLRPPTRAWWDAVVAEYELTGHGLRLLRLACEAWDRGQEAREALAANGLTFDDRFGAPRARPEVAIERDARVGFARLLRELALDAVPPPEPSRPPPVAGGRRYGRGANPVEE